MNKWQRLSKRKGFSMNNSTPEKLGLKQQIGLKRKK